MIKKKKTAWTGPTVSSPNKDAIFFYIYKKENSQQVWNLTDSGPEDL